MGRGRTKLKEHWLTHDSYKSWIRKASSPYYARRCRCNCDQYRKWSRRYVKKASQNKKHNELQLVCTNNVNILDYCSTKSVCSTNSIDLESQNISNYGGLIRKSTSSSTISSSSSKNLSISNEFDACTKAARAEVKTLQTTFLQLII